MLRRLLVLSSVLVVLLATATSFAAMTIQNPRREGTSRILAATPFDKNMGNAGFNRSDCFDTKQIVKLFVATIPSDADHVELWVRRDNTSCANPVNWPGGTDPQCARVKSWTYEAANNRDVDFKPIEVIQAIHRRAHADTAVLDPNTVCIDTTSMTPTEFYFQMMAFKGDRVLGWTSGGTAAGEVAALQSSYDIAGPNPPSNMQTGAGNGILVTTFTGAANPPADFNGYRAYCFPSRSGVTTVTDTGTTTVTDTGVADTGTVADTFVEDVDATSDATTEETAAVEDTGTSSTTTDAAIPENCPPGVPFVPGEIPSPAMDQFICLEGNNSASGKLTISGLTNGTNYAVAVAASDRHGNSGALSTVVCATPKQTDDFYTLYRNAGGTAGGGWCSIGTNAKSAGLGVFGFTILFGLIARAWRRHSR
jgi:hypothetical protein